MVGLSVLPGDFFGGGGLVNQLKKVSIEVDTTCSAKSNSGSDRNHQSAVAIPDHDVVSGRQTGRTLISTIRCGGADSRLSPVSRELPPKPFIRLANGQDILRHHTHATVVSIAHARWATLSMLSRQFNACSASFCFHRNLALGVAVNKPCNRTNRGQ
jgi:hypothetical protein